MDDTITALDTTAATAVDFFERMPEQIRLSSRALGWSPLNFERREPPPSRERLDGGSTEHLVFLSLGAGMLRRKKDGEPEQQFQLSPGWIAIQPAQTPMSYAWDRRLDLCVLGLEPRYVDRVAERMFGTATSNFKITAATRENDPAISNIAGVLAREVVRADTGAMLYAESLASILTVHLLRNYASVPAVAASELPAPGGTARVTSRAVADAMRCVQRNFATALSLEDIASAARVSPFHLSRLFKRTVGVSPYQYLIQTRVNAARSLLSASSGQRSLAEIATAVGFADQSHLTRHCKRVLGVTPAGLRNA